MWKGARCWVESNSSISSKSGIRKWRANFEPWYLPIGSTVWFLSHVVFLLHFCRLLCDHLSTSTKKNPKRKKPSIFFLCLWAYITFLELFHYTQIISVLYVLMQRLEGPWVYEKFANTPHSWSWRSWFWQTIFFGMQMTVLTVYVFLYGKVYLVCIQKSHNFLCLLFFGLILIGVCLWQNLQSLIFCVPERKKQAMSYV